MAKTVFLPRYRFASPLATFLVLFGLWVCFWSGEEASVPMPYAILEPIRSVGLTVFRSAANIRLVFLVAVVAHVAEAIYAYTLVAADRDVAFKAFWVIQTFVVGYPSLGLLLNGKVNLGGKRK